MPKKQRNCMNWAKNLNTVVRCLMITSEAIIQMIPRIVTECNRIESANWSGRNNLSYCMDKVQVQQLVRLACFFFVLFRCLTKLMLIFVTRIFIAKYTARISLSYCMPCLHFWLTTHSEKKSELSLSNSCANIYIYEF